MILHPSMRFERLDHHGIVAGVLRDIGFFDISDEVFCDYGGEEISDGQAIAAMIINGLGFTDRALSLTDEFFELLPTEKLLGDGVTPDTLNRHKLSRALDKIYNFGCSKFFSLIASRAVLTEKIDKKTQSLDTSTFSLTGSYDSEADTEAINIVRGHSKDHRPDLKQLVAELIVSHDGDVPLGLKAHSGNASDSIIFKERCDAIVEQFDREQVLIADSKLYCLNNSKNLSRISYVTRIPEVLKEAKTTIKEAVGKIDQWFDPKCKLCTTTKRINHYGIKQNWHICISKESLDRATASLQRRVGKEREEVEKALFHLQAQRFNCLPDAIKAYETVGRKLKYHTLSEPSTIVHPKFSGRGKPAKDAIPISETFQVKGNLIESTDHNLLKAQEKACFIVGTNKLEKTAETIISAYKTQASVERGFRFLKDPSFFAQSFYLKKPERIEALVTIMTLALLVFTVAQRRIRKAVADQPPFVPNSSKKPYKNPTLKRIFQIFQGINAISDIKDGMRHYVIQLKEIQHRILEALGGEALKIYSG